MAGKQRANHEAWFILDDAQVLGYDRAGRNQKLLLRTKKGMPSGSWAFDSQADAQNHLDGMKACGEWPLFAPVAKVEKIKF